ncbi:DMT family transporter [Defluviimonas sp. WL0024]|uniref:DMT family transporter n=1 Tax=Albidovulum salinarum TaxID=2984153 RepID=A0ABT2XA78_9RHOB|nr:DMT family transporter [Defluviimonas sp. WL0024]MCU9850314.1 DMT family transporter [Defluviimonas sp. WL0024]
MATATIMPETNRTLLAAVAILGYALAIGYTDNYVQVIAREAGLWQFHATRTVMAFAIVALVAVPLGLRLRPRKPGAVALRSAIHGVAMFIYFGCLAFLPVATVAAGLFTAPIFTLLISRFAFGIPIGPFRVAGVVLGFAGAILVLGPGQGGAIGLATVLPIAAGALYALGNIATRQWCEGESAETLLLGFFAMLGFLGLIGCAVLALWQPAVPEGADGFILRGLVWPSPDFLFWTFVQAAGSLIGVGLMIKAYQIAEASRVAIFEYVILPASAFWAFVLWGDLLDLRAVAGIGLIFAAGLIIALRGR